MKYIIALPFLIVFQALIGIIAVLKDISVSLGFRSDCCKAKINYSMDSYDQGYCEGCDRRVV